MKGFLSVKRFSLLFTSLFLVSLKICAQDFGAVGTTWYYNNPHLMDPGVDYTEIKSISDTVVGGQPCHHLQRIHGGDCTLTGPDFYVYEDEGGKVFYYVDALNLFSLLYDFNLQAGDTLKGYVNGVSQLDSFLIHIDLVSADTINGHPLKMFICHNLSIWSFSTYASDTIVERIGSKGYLFPQFGACDPPAGALRCYEDSLLGLYSTGLTPSCDTFLTAINTIDQPTTAITIYPNPSKGIFQINSDVFVEMKIDVEVYNSIGNKILNTTSPQNKTLIDLSNQVNGIYFLRLKNMNSEYWSKLLLSK